jgi:hypothetical protein
VSDNQPPKEPDLELARPLRPPAPGLPSSTSNPNSRAVSASRLEPLPGEASRQLTKERLQEGAADTVLNSVSILAEVIEDFRRSDRFFKYKAMVITLWLLLSVGAFGVACPSTGPSNAIHAQLIVSGEASAPIYMVKNDGTDAWQDVEIIVNGRYRSTMTQLSGEGGSATLSSAVLFDTEGKRAPARLAITEIVVKVRAPEAEVTLLTDGVPVR